jgi:exonuclease VII large subunit
LGDKYVTAAEQLAPSDKVTMQFANGTAEATVTNVPEKQE